LTARRSGGVEFGKSFGFDRGLRGRVHGQLPGRARLARAGVLPHTEADHDEKVPEGGFATRCRIALRGWRRRGRAHASSSACSSNGWGDAAAGCTRPIENEQVALDRPPLPDAARAVPAARVAGGDLLARAQDASGGRRAHAGLHHLSRGPAGARAHFVSRTSPRSPAD